MLPRELELLLPLLPPRSPASGDLPPFLLLKDVLHGVIVRPRPLEMPVPLPPLLPASVRLPVKLLLLLPPVESAAVLTLLPALSLLQRLLLLLLARLLLLLLPPLPLRRRRPLLIPTNLLFAVISLPQATLPPLVVSAGGFPLRAEVSKMEVKGPREEIGILPRLSPRVMLVGSGGKCLRTIV